MYNYKEAMKQDLEQFIKEGIECGQFDKNELDYDTVYDSAWIEDSVTGNGSGSYTFNRNMAKEYVLQNMELAVEAYNEFCDDIGKDLRDYNWERIDVSIRCYLLGEMLTDVITTFD